MIFAAAFTSFATLALIALLAVWVSRWLGWIDESLHQRYLDKARNAELENDTDWAYRCQNRAWDTLSYRRWTDRIPPAPPPVWLLAVTALLLTITSILISKAL